MFRREREPLLLAAPILAIFGVAGLVIATRYWTPIGDWAIAESIVRRIPNSWPLSGPYSAARGYNHPLPWIYYLEWLPYRLTGNRSATAQSVLVWWYGAWFAALAWLLVRRRALVLLTLTIPAVVALGLHAEGSPLRSPWNPHFAIAPAAFLVFAAWRLACGESALLPWVVGAAILAVGMHLAYLPLAAGLVLVAVVLWLVARRHDRGPLRAPLRRTAAVAGILLAPAVLDLLLHGRASNPWRIVDHNLHASGPRLPDSEVFKLLRAELALPPTWLHGKIAYSIFLYRPAPQFPWLALLAIVVVGFAVYRRARHELVLLAITGTMLVAATAGLLRADDNLFKPWYVLVMHLAGACAWIAVIWSAARTVRHYLKFTVPDSARLAVAAVAVAAASVFAVVQSMPAWMGPAGDVVRPLAEAAARTVPHDRPVIVDAPFAGDGYFAEAFVLMLERDGIDARVPRAATFLYGGRLGPPPGPAPRVFLRLTSPGDAIVAPEPGLRRLRSETIPDGLTFAGSRYTVWYAPQS